MLRENRFPIQNRCRFALDPATARAKFAQSKTHPARAMISLKCHSIMPFGADAPWMDRLPWPSVPCP
jgi:hypothetical protein